MVDTISSIVINIISSFLYDGMNCWKEKKQIQNFKDEMTEWVQNFEQKNDGTIITKGVFIGYIENYKVIQKIMQYVLSASDKDEGEEDFIKTIHKDFEQYAAEQQVQIGVLEHSILKEFFNTILEKTKNFIFDKVDIMDRAILYSIMQNRLDLREVAVRFQITEALLKKLEKEILQIRISLNPQSYSDDWFLMQNNEQIKNLGNRYLPELNITTNTSRVLDGLARNEVFYERLGNKTDHFLIAVGKVKLPECKEAVEFVQGHIESVLQNAETLLERETLVNTVLEIQSVISSTIDDLLSKNDNNDTTIYFLREAYEQAEYYLEYLDSKEIFAFLTPYVLIDGEGGCGKSHLIADTVQNRSNRGAKSVLFLGQHFKGHTNPMQEMMQLLGTKDGFDAFLENMNRIGQQENQRVILFIDALNEGNGKEIWQDYLSGILEKLKSYKWLGLVASIRSEYKRYLFKENKTLEENLVLVRHKGFQSISYEAIKKYFRFYNIEYMEIPFENQEFENPLFLRLFCEAYQGESVNLTGIDLKTVYDKYLEKINERISDKCDVNYRYKIVQKTIRAIVAYKFEKNAGNNIISMDEIIDIILENQQKYGCKGDLLEELLSEGILTQNVLWNGEEYIYITYERMEDYVYAEMLCEELAQMSVEKFEEKYIYLLEMPGILNCLAVESWQSHEKEIFEIFDGEHINIKKAFIESLKWRNDRQISKKTQKYINDSILCDGSVVCKFVETLILICTRRDFAFNADSLVNFLCGMSMPDRDAFLIPILNFILKDKECAINRLLDWGMESNKNEEICAETIRLSSLTLSVFLSSSNRLLRDKATKTMVHLLKGHVDIVIYLLKRYEKIDDPYIVERLYAVAFGCVVSESDKSKIHALAKVVFDNIFNADIVYPNVLVRDYALNIIDYAVYQIGKVDFDVKKCEPPYNTTMPDVLTDEEIAAYKYDYKAPDFKDYYWSQNSILSSMHVEYTRNGQSGGYGDFGRYTFQRYFSQWRGLNYNDLENIAVKKIFDMGYDVEKHGRFDRHVESGRAASGKIERIGKKYQWIALYELAAQVSDNYMMKMDDSDYTGIESAYCRGAYEPNIRNLDPTINQIPSSTKKTIHESIYKIPSISHEEWLENFDDFPQIENMIYRQVNNQRFLLLNGWYAWEEVKKIGEERYHNPLKDMWIQINGYIVKREKLGDYVKALKDADFMGRYLAEPSEDYTLFNKEYYWSHAYHFFQNPYYGGEEKVPLHKYGEKYNHLPNVLVPTRKYATERNGDLLHEDRYSSWYKPCLELFKGLGMKYGKENSILYDENGKMLCFDSIELLKENIGFFIDEETFLEFLEKEGYSIVWTVLSEKRIITGHFAGKREYAMPHISGVFYLDDERQLVGELFGIKED